MFKNIVNRTNTNCAKWDELIEKVGIPDIISLTVADMDFVVAPEIQQAVLNAAVHGIYGYTNVSKNYIDLSHKWITEKYHWELKKEWIVFCPRVIQAISLCIQNMTCVDDKIIVFTPLYGSILNAIRENNRELVTSTLNYNNGHYEIDFRDFEKKLSSGVKMLIMVSPHNPIGRVWDRDEIDRIVALCKKYEVLIFSDEIHADFVWDKKFVSFGSFLNDYDKIVIGTSPAKTFNIAGLEASNIIFKNVELRNLFINILRQSGIHNPSYFCIPAVEAAYRYGDEWLKLAKKEILGNIEFAKNFFSNELKGFEVIKTEGTYTLWVDYRKTGMSEEQMYDLMINKANVAFSLGSGFGKEGEGFVRINVATPRRLLEKAFERFKKAICN